MTPPPASNALLVDAHVHLHPCFDTSIFFEHALSHFAEAAHRLNRHQILGCLMFTECAGHRAFDALADGSLLKNAPRWSVTSTSEPETLLVARDNQPAMLLMAGRQIITADRLEVLALACGQRFDDGAPTHVTCERILSCGGLPVLPWAFGKWWGKRGLIVRKLLDSSLADQLFLGDNANRPTCAPLSSILRDACSRGIPVLPGSDPLPLPEQMTRAGSYGFFLDQPISMKAPAQTLCRALRAHRIQWAAFGRRTSLPGFVRANIRLRMQKDRNRSLHRA